MWEGEKLDEYELMTVEAEQWYLRAQRNLFLHMFENFYNKRVK